jgi:hypothetical protein
MVPKKGKASILKSMEKRLSNFSEHLHMQLWTLIMCRFLCPSPQVLLIGSGWGASASVSQNATAENEDDDDDDMSGTNTPIQKASPIRGRGAAAAEKSASIEAESLSLTPDEFGRRKRKVRGKRNAESSEYSPMVSVPPTGIEESTNVSVNLSISLLEGNEDDDDDDDENNAAGGGATEKQGGSRFKAIAPKEAIIPAVGSAGAHGDSAKNGSDVVIPTAKEIATEIANAAGLELSEEAQAALIKSQEELALLGGLNTVQGIPGDSRVTYQRVDLMARTAKIRDDVVNHAMPVEVTRSIFRSLFINDEERRRSLTMFVKVKTLDDTVLGTFKSEPVKVISKPSKKKGSRNLDCKYIYMFFFADSFCFVFETFLKTLCFCTGM